MKIVELTKEEAKICLAMFDVVQELRLVHRDLPLKVNNELDKVAKAIDDLEPVGLLAMYRLEKKLKSFVKPDTNIK